jgi:hypothetical protein
MRALFFFFALISGGSSSACPDRGPNIILFTWDGVRTRDFFRGTDLLHRHEIPSGERGPVLPLFWGKRASQGVVLGGFGRFKIASHIAISLPSYQALLTGHPTRCEGNGCGPVQESTFLERVRHELGLQKSEVAIFASWEGLSRAFARDPAKVTHGIFPEMFDEGGDDPEMRRLQEQAMNDLPPWGGSRKDEYTFRMGMHYLKTRCPRLLYISLVDSDEFGHQRNYRGYTRSLRTYDLYLEELLSTLESMGEFGKQTTVFVTTDHSRGPGPFWVGHANTKYSERGVFLYAWGRGVRPAGRSCARGGHAMLRPTIEYLMGIQPSDRILPGIQIE